MANFNKLTLIEAREKLKAGEIKCSELVKDCFEQIEHYDDTIGAFLALRKADALDEAEKADKQIEELGEDAFKDKPLLGIPYACKDNFSTKDVETTAASKVLEGYIPPFESTVTKRLKDAGAILLGKTNMDAFAHGSSTETSDYKTTKNPWNTNKVPGGSSGGSAAAVAANMCIFATGSETAGSIRGPAGWCGVTGLKPTYGRVSRYGVIAMASSTDSPGPVTKTVEDSSLILSVIAGKDESDATTSPEPTEDYYKDLNNFSFEGIKIGMPKSYFEIELEEGVKERVTEALHKFEELGAQIVEIDLIDPTYSIGVYTILQRSEVSSNLARFDGIRYGHSRKEFNFENRKRMMLGAYALSAGYYDKYYAKAQKVRTLIVEDFKKAFEEVDFIVGPSMPSVAPDLGVANLSPLFGEMVDLLQEPSAIAGLCGIAIPCGFSDGMPVGVQLIGNLLDESKILGAAHKYQQTTDFHRKFPELRKDK